MASTLPVLLGVWLVAVITPGPDFLVIVRHATTGSRRHGLAAAIGTNCGILTWATGSMLGLSVLMARLSWLYDCVRLAGAAYLIVLGARLLWTSRHAPTPEIPAEPERSAGRSLLRAYRSGFLTNAANPKAVVFFGSLLGALLPAHPSVGTQVVVIASIVATSTIWYALVVGLFASRQVVGVYRRIRHWIDRAAAVIFVALGGRLALQR
ncbi:MAG TPA: LysE family translocator [Mycobacteriales bacterium]|nr:LysE family translocator [Mycobacteriales bacterium]